MSKDVTSVVSFVAAVAMVSHICVKHPIDILNRPNFDDIAHF